MHSVEPEVAAIEGHTKSCVPGSVDDGLTNINWLVASATVLPNPSGQHDTSEQDPPTPPDTPTSSDTSSPIHGHDYCRKRENASPITASTNLKNKKTNKVPQPDYMNEPLKPPHSYAQLITMAMKAHGGEKVVLNDIYEWVRAHYAFYRQGDNSWQNSIRHNLSLNKQFVKISRDVSDKGKGSYWRLDTAYKDPYCIRRRNFNDSKNKSDKPTVTRPQINPAIKSFLQKSNLAPMDQPCVITVDDNEEDTRPYSGGIPHVDILTSRSTTLSSGIFYSSVVSPHAEPLSTTDRVKVEYNWEAYEYTPNHLHGIQLPLQLSPIANANNGVNGLQQLQPVVSLVSSVGLSPSSSEETDAATSGLELRIPTPEWWATSVTNASLMSPTNTMTNCNYLARVFESAMEDPTTENNHSHKSTTVNEIATTTINKTQGKEMTIMENNDDNSHKYTPLPAIITVPQVTPASDKEHPWLESTVNDDSNQAKTGTDCQDNERTSLYELAPLKAAQPDGSDGENVEVE